jgi:hypothetical protein
MLRLMLVLHTVIATVLMGVGVTAALATNHVEPRIIIGAAVAGFVLAFPASWLVARRIIALRT